MRRFDQRTMVAATSVVLFAGTLTVRAIDLGRPRVQVFDEVYYANDALDIFLHGAERGFAVHPPLGKDLIATGIATYGFTPVGWRVASLVCGAVVVSLAYVCAVQLTGRLWYSLAAPALVLLDGIATMTGRLALLDGIVSLFTTLALILCARRPKRPLLRAVLVGVTLGLASAVKWSALPLIPVALGVFGWRLRRHRLAAVRAVLALGTAAVTAYSLTYLPWIVSGGQFGDCTARECSQSAWGRLTQLPTIQRAMFDYNLNLQRRNPQLAPAWDWSVQNRPTALLSERCRGVTDAVCGTSTTGIVTLKAQGNRVLWPVGTVVVLATVAALIAQSRRRTAAALPALWVAALWLPWLATTKTYTFYAAPIVPALALSLIVFVDAAMPRRWASRAVSCGVAASAVAFVLAWRATGV